MGGKPLLGAEGWVLSLALLPADLRGNKEGSERLAAVCLPVSVGDGRGGVFPHLHPPSSPGLSWAVTRTLKVPARPPPAACFSSCSQLCPGAGGGHALCSRPPPPLLRVWGTSGREAGLSAYPRSRQETLGTMLRSASQSFLSGVSGGLLKVTCFFWGGRCCV